MKDFFELREAKASAQFTDHTPDKDFNDLAKKHKVKVTHDKNDEKTIIHGDEKAVLSVLKTMYGNDWKDMYTKKGSVYVDESVKTEDKGQFIYAAKQAKKKGDSTFVFAGKTYNCEEVLENEDLKESLLNENYRTLARAGMGTESKGEARVGLELDYYDGSGTKRMGKITKVTPKGYMIKDEKDGKVRQFTYHDRAKAKEILARIGKGKYNESV